MKKELKEFIGSSLKLLMYFLLFTGIILFLVLVMGRMI